MTRIAGVDEAGRGPLAGPVVAAAVVLPRVWIQEGIPASLEKLNDSKQLSARKREEYFEILMGHPQVQCGVAQVEAAEIDVINILRATWRAMNEAVQQVSSAPEHLLVDGNSNPELSIVQTAVVRGDSLSYSIAAASVIAKVTRDRLMTAYDQEYPGYGFAAHKGYGTAAHLAALARQGPCPLHRRSFAPLKQPELELFT
jgi:ribonuclease HII